jgi:peptidoglycan/LPS O-acetylase OafA/YrhL
VYTNLSILRLILAGWVLLAHLVPWYFFVAGRSIGSVQTIIDTSLLLQPGGALHPAVIGFLVLSGFVITQGFGLSDSLKLNRLKLRPWAIRRFFRIYPIYLLGTALGGLLFFFQDVEIYRQLSGTNALSFRCLALKATGLQAAFPVSWPGCLFQGNAPLVTTSSEIALYVVFGLLVYVGLRKSRWVLVFGALGFTWVISTFFVFLLSPTVIGLSSYWTHASPVNYILPWFAGASLAFMKFPKRHISIPLVIFAISLGALLSLSNQERTTSLDIMIAQCQLVLFTAFWVVVVQKLIEVRQISYKVAEALEFSYPLYALHAPIGMFMLICTSNFWIALTSILAVSIFVHYFLERPVRNFGRRISSVNANY